jgi:hypothetical protein
MKEIITLPAAMDPSDDNDDAATATGASFLFVIPIIKTATTVLRINCYLSNCSMGYHRGVIGVGCCAGLGTTWIPLL